MKYEVWIMNYKVVTWETQLLEFPTFFLLYQQRFTSMGFKSDFYRRT